MNETDISKFFEQNKTALVAYAHRALGNMQDAEDALQDTMIILIERKTKLDEIKGIRAWVYGVLKKVILSYYRKRQREKAVIQNDMVLQKPFQKLTPSLTVEYERSLPKFSKHEDHELLLLLQFFYIGFSMKELCKYYGIGESACKMRIRRYRLRMLQELNG